MKNEELTLVNGTYSATDAQHLLLSLVNHKIDFHTIEKWSHEERFGRDHDHSIRRLHELEQLHGTLKQLCKQAAEEGMQLKIKGQLSIEMVPAQTPELASAQ